MKKLILEILDYYRYKIENDECTAEDMKTVYDALSKGVVCETTIKDLAEFYGQSENNVRNVISRKVIKKPRRMILYNFLDVIKIIPKSWRSK